MAKKYIVTLSSQERQELEAIVRKQTIAAFKRQRALVLLKADTQGEAWTDERIASVAGCSTRSIEHIREKFVKEGLCATLDRKKRATPPTAPILDGAGVARVTALACSVPPEGRSRWTLQLLADKLIELQIVETISDETVRRTLKKTNSNRTVRRAG